MMAADLPARADTGVRPNRDRPVDLAHLARQTMGNRDLEREVLQLFVRQSAACLERLAGEAAPAEQVAHTLVGSALGIGAHAVARAAAAVEDAARHGRPVAGPVETLAATVEEANAFIRSLFVPTGRREAHTTGT